MTTLANRLAMVGLLLALGCVATILLAGLGYRFGWWPYGSGIATIAVVFWVAAGSAALCAVAAGLAVTRVGARRALVMGLAGLAIAAAQGVLASMGLELVAADAAQGRIEATATSLLFGFKDDVVVRIASAPDGTKVDIRSKSRVGRHDIGMNAKRIRAFLAKLEAAVK
jgi:hypothetical protein